MTASLHPQIEAGRQARRAALWQATRDRLRQVLNEVLPGVKVWLFGSITRPERFHERSDVDLALEKLPDERSHIDLLIEIDTRLERSVDLVLLNESRLRDKILSTGELWTN